MSLSSPGSLLQWGRGHVAAETLDKIIELLTKKLQWGRGDVAAETSNWNFKRYDAAGLQWGRGHVAAETQQ